MPTIRFLSSITGRRRNLLLLHDAHGVFKIFIVTAVHISCRHHFPRGQLGRISSICNCTNCDVAIRYHAYQPIVFAYRKCSNVEFAHPSRQILYGFSWLRPFHFLVHRVSDFHGTLHNVH